VPVCRAGGSAAMMTTGTRSVRAGFGSQSGEKEMRTPCHDALLSKNEKGSTCAASVPIIGRGATRVPPDTPFARPSEAHRSNLPRSGLDSPPGTQRLHDDMEVFSFLYF